MRTVGWNWRLFVAMTWFPVLVGGLGLTAPLLERGPVFCTARLLWGMPGPGCGMTRALGYLFRGDLSRSLYFHPLAPVVALYLLAVWVLGLLAVTRGFRPPVKTTAALVGLLVVALIVAWGLRMRAFAEAGAIPPEFGRPQTRFPFFPRSEP